MPPADDDRTGRWLLAGLLVLAAALRVVALGTVPGFNGDEGAEVYYARQFAETGVPRLHPIRPYLGPYLLWTTAPLIKVFGTAPAVVRFLPAVWGTLGVWLAWRVARRAAGPQAGLAAAALLAVAPWSVAYSRLVLSVGFVPTFALLGWWLMQRLVEDPSGRRGAAVGAALGAAVVFHPTGLLVSAAVVAGAAVFVAGEPDVRRALLTRPVLGAAAAGFAATAWPAAAFLGGLVGVGPGVDVGLTHVDEEVWRGPLGRVTVAFRLLLQTTGGDRTLAWITGSDHGTAYVVLRAVPLLLLAGLGSAAALAGRGDRWTRALFAAIAATTVVVGLQSASFDLHVASRERYLLVPATLTVLLAGRGLVAFGALAASQAHAPGPAWGWMIRRRLGDPATDPVPATPAAAAILATATVAAWMLLSGTALTEAAFRLHTSAAAGGPSFVVASPDAKLQAARWIAERMEPGDEGLLWAADGWSYWPTAYFVGEAMPSDFIPEDVEVCASELTRTRHRRRFLVEYAGGGYVPRILDCLDAAGYPPTNPTLVVDSAAGPPLLGVWELPPEPEVEREIEPPP